MVAHAVVEAVAGFFEGGEGGGDGGGHEVDVLVGEGGGEEARVGEHDRLQVETGEHLDDLAVDALVMLLGGFGCPSGAASAGVGLPVAEDS